MNINISSKLFSMRGLTRCILTLVLLGLCQSAADALPSTRKQVGTFISGTERLKPSRLKAPQRRAAAEDENGVSMAVSCNMVSEEWYTQYDGTRLSNYHTWFWCQPANIYYEENQTVLRYTSEGTPYFYFNQEDGGAPLEAIKIFVDKSRTNNAELHCCNIDFETGAININDEQFTIDNEKGIIYWKPEKYDYGNVCAYVGSGEINVTGFEIYSEGQTPDDFFTSGTPDTPETVKAPAFLPEDKSFTRSVSVEMHADEGCEIYFTTNGDIPTISEGNKYTGPIVISSTTTFKAIAVNAEGEISSVATATYTCRLHGIGEGYDPTSPGNPDGDVSKPVTYTLYTVTNPAGAGTTGGGSSNLTPGSQVYVSTYPYNGFVFKNWTIEGTEVSTESSFNYLMPDYDVALVANYEYNPSNPGNPDPQEQVVKHPVVTRVMPSGAGYTSPSATFSMEENTSRSIYAYPYNGWKFVGWTVNGEEHVQTTSPINITMGEKALDIAAYFKYDPTLPSNPGANYYNPSTGQMIVDDFTPGELYNAITGLTGGSYTNISSLIVKGVMTSNDVGTLGYLTNAETIDISRTGGVTNLPNYAFSDLSASSILLPYTVAKIGNYDFSGCANLSSLTVYAMEPPVCDSRSFANFTNKDNCTVYVPAEAIELYAAAEYWKDFIILPITDDAHVLQVNLPADASDGRYKNNSIEIVNVNSGVRQKYVVSDRLLYTFNGLRKDEQYNIYMFSQAGLEIGRIEGVTIPDRDMEVTFDTLKSLHTVFAKILDADGNDVTSQTSVEWLKPLADGTMTYLRNTTSLGEVPEGQQLVCRVTLDSKLGTVYANPEDAQYTVSPEANTCTVTLVPFRTIELTGNVKDGDGTALADASVSVNQTLNGKFSKSYTTRTDRGGLWKLTVLDAPETRLTYSANECVNVNDTIGAFAADINTLDIGTTTLRSIVGARVTYGFTHRAAGAQEADTYYADYQNVAISVYNVTQERPHNEVSLQYPLLAVLDENIHSGDVLKLTASSKKGAFNPIEKTVTIGEDQRAEVTFDIIGKGGIAASFEMTDNPAVTAMLYSDKGELLKKSNYSEAKVTFTELEDGDYTLVSMGKSDLMNSILRLANFEEIGLSEGKDYVKNTVSVESGHLTEVKNAEIPAFDESLFYYTTPTTGFTANKSSLTTGNYLTLRSAIDFKGVYKNDISNVALVVDLPESCDLVEQSVIQGPNLLPYTLDNNRLTVQLGSNYQSQTRFCVIPTAGGSFNATASVVFDYNGKPLTQPIGTATSNVKDIEISVPEIVTSRTLHISGAATPKAKVTLIVDGVPLSTTNVNNAGRWDAECSLSDSHNMAEYSVYAKIETTSGNILSTETKTFQYIRNYPTIKTVTMHSNPVVVFDFENNSTSQSWYYTPSNVLFTLDFTNNNPDVLREVYLNLFGEDGSVQVIDCNYDANKNLWFANVVFSAYNGVVNLSVNYIASGNYSYDSAEASLIAQKQEDLIDKEEKKLNEFDNLLTETFDKINSDDLSEDEVIRYITIVRRKIKDYYNPGGDDVPVDYGHLSDPNYIGGDVILYGERPEDANPELDPFYKKLESPYNKTVSVPNLGNSNSIQSNTGADSTSYVAPGNFDYESLAGNEPGTMSFTISNSNGDAWQCDNGNNIPVDVESKDSVKAFFDSAQAEQENLLHEWANSPDGILTALNMSAALAMSYQHGNLDRNLAQLTALAGNRTPAVQQEITALRTTMRQNLNKLSNARIASNVISGIAAFAGGWTIGTDITSGYSRYDEWTQIIKTIEASCEGDDVSGLIEKAKGYRAWILKRDAGKTAADIGSTALGIAGAVMAPETFGASLLLNMVSAGISMGTKHWQHSYTKTNAEHIAEIAREARKSASCPDEPFPLPGSNPNSPYYGDYNPNTPPFDPLTINHDPAGYVYEAVPENRVEGVQASIYYKETKEDMYGDPYEEIILWNAEEYAQRNPLFTDEYGMYRWDVPQGLWQVKFEKDGYQTAYSDWLPVPPPQLEVNIGIVQNKQPEVTEARAYEEGVEVQFDKYMDPATLNTSNIYVTANNEKLAGEIHLIDSALADEYASEEDAEAVRYASRLRFVPAQPLSITTGEVRVTVSRNVLSYAGIPMTETFSQALDVEKEVQSITADDVKVLYGGEKEVTVYALPYDAAVGRTLRIANSSDLIASVDVSEATLDDEGKAVIKVKGDLPGRTQLTFTIDDVTATGDCAVDVVTEIITAEAPKSSRASGTAVYRGTKVELSTDSKDATIYFTTDGSCPCDENGTRRKYSVPIVINEDTQIKAMTTVGNGADETSETVEFNYTLKRSDMDFGMAEGWTWISHNFETPVAPASLAADENISRIMSQTREVIRDPQLGLVGTLTELPATESFKVQTTAATARQRLSDVAWNPATPISLKAGWNWLGYPVGQTMSVDEAFAPTAAEALDVVVGQNGFAQFDGESWTGTLETLSPGMGYMYQSQSAKNVVYNTSIVSTAASTFVPGISDNSMLAIDIHKYGSIMPIVATLLDKEGEALQNEDFRVAAFCGSECRGIGRVVNGLVMMNVYGNANDEISFSVTDAAAESAYDNNASLRFSETMTGDIFNPYEIRIDSQSGVSAVNYDGNVRLAIDGDMMHINGVPASAIEMVEMYDVNGQKRIHETHVSESGINISFLTTGVYVVIVKADGEYSYHKVAIR